MVSLSVNVKTLLLKEVNKKGNCVAITIHEHKFNTLDADTQYYFEMMG